MRTGLAHGAFYNCFTSYFPDIKVITHKNISDTKDMDLIIFSGGEDINPRLYGESNRYSQINEERDELEIEIYRIAKAYNIKMLGICRGHQLLNVLEGGYLLQDIYLQKNLYHSGSHGLELINQSYLPFESIIGKIFKQVNSLHHQGLIHPGNIFPTSQYNEIIESCESDKFITVQFHPELMRVRESEIFFDEIKTWVSGGFKKKSKKPYTDEELRKVFRSKKSSGSFTISADSNPWR